MAGGTADDVATLIYASGSTRYGIVSSRTRRVRAREPSVTFATPAPSLKRRHTSSTHHRHHRRQGPRNRWQLGKTGCWRIESPTVVWSVGSYSLAGLVQPFSQQVLSFFSAFAACRLCPAEQLDELLVAAAFGVVDVGVQL